MNKIIFFSLFLFSITFSFSQQYSEVIQWNKPMSIDNGEQSYLAPNFEGVHYDNGIPKVFFKKSFKGSNLKVSSVSLITANALQSEINYLSLMNVRIAEFNPLDIKFTKAAHNAFLVVSGVPFIKENGLVKRIVKITVETETNLTAVNKDFVGESVLMAGSGDWYKISIQNDGLYKIDFNFLESIGVDVSNLNPKHVHVFGNGDGKLPELNSLPRTDDLAQNSVQYFGASDNTFNQNDFILFYGFGPNRWVPNGTSDFNQIKNIYTDYSFYFININSERAPLEIGDKPTLNELPTSNITSYDYRACYENDLISLIGGGQRWYGELFDINLEQTFNFSIPNISGESVFFKTAIATNSTSPGGTSQKYSVNGEILLDEGLPHTSVDYVRSSQAFILNNPPISGNIPLKITIQRNSPSVLTYLDRICLNTRRNLSFYGSQMGFRNLTNLQAGIGNFQIQNFPSTGFIWDITDRHNPIRVSGSQIGSSFEFLDSISYREYVASNGGTFFSPEFVGAIDYQNLHALEQADYLIVTHPNFKSQADRLAALHRNNGLTVHVVTTSQIFNEFSSGAPDAVAIRSFAKMFYDRSQVNPETAPKYLLLFGDGTFDPKDRVPDNNNFVLTYQVQSSENHISALVTDDFYGMLDDGEAITGSDLLDIGIGRILASNITQAEQQVDKIEHYMKNGSDLFANTGASCCLEDNSLNTFGDWRQKYVQVADDEESGYFINNDTEPQYNHTKQNHNEMNCDKLYLDAFPQQTSAGGQRYPDVVNAITDRIQRGALIFNYVGHGGEVGLAEERVVTIPQINSWNNINALTLFVSATCEFTKYDDPARVSAGEWAALNPNGGAIALMTTTRSVYFGVNTTTGNKFFQNVFDRNPDGSSLAFGDIVMRTKNETGSSDNKRSFTLIGDPALKLATPDLNIVTDSINGIAPSIAIDTIRALSKVVMKGHVEDHMGNVLSDFNGILTPSIFDKIKLQKTLGQDLYSPEIEYELQRNVIYKGKVSVTNGAFEYSFVVPKDISLNYGKGKISYYGFTQERDAGGYDTSIIIGGIDPNGISDAIGPEITLFMNDENFVSGGQTDFEPILLAKIFDENGVNTVGNGIGHDITAILDGNSSEPFILNDFYVADLDSYQSGEIRFQFDGLSPGRHSLEFKVWDVNNNSSKSTIEFVVVDDENLTLQNVLNYPNPFTSSTEFMFEHSFACNELEVQIQIFTVSGRLVQTLNEIIPTQGFRVNQIFWDGTDNYGDQLAKGVYIYRVKVKDTSGQTAEKTEKLVILK
jgi:hypothetical protein